MNNNNRQRGLVGSRYFTLKIVLLGTLALVAVLFPLLLQTHIIFSLHTPPHDDQPVNHTLTHLPPNNDNLPSRESVLENQSRESVHRIAFITFSYVKHNDTDKLFNFLLPAVDTWAAPTPTPSSSSEHNRTTTFFDNWNDEFKNVGHQKDFPSLYVVFSHTSRKAFDDACLHNDKLPPHQRKLCRRIHPIYVDCPEGRYGESPCCKQQKGLVEIFDKKYPLYDWYAFFDDDVYLRKEYVARLLAKLQPPDFPMAAAPYNQPAKFIGHRLKQCGKGMEEFLYPWGMPVFYSRGAVKMMESGYRANSLVSQCAAFHITHDVGNQVLNWMYSLPMARLPPHTSLPQMSNDYIGNHLVGRKDKELATILGKRNVSEAIRSIPLGSWSFYETHKKWMDPKLKPPRVELLNTVKDQGFKWYKNVTGFHQTLTYELHGDPQTWGEGHWFTMQYSDCIHAAVVEVEHTYGPLWLGRDDGWMGGSYSDAVNFCSNTERHLCPFQAYCPHGAKEPTMPGFPDGFDTNDEHYSPVAEVPNAWVNVGKKNGDSATTCRGYDQLYPNQPDWGLTSAQPELKRYVLCCHASR